MKKMYDIIDITKKLFSTGFFHIFSSSVINKILTFLSNIIVVRLISKLDYGVFVYADNIVSMILIATGMGLVSGTFQLCSEKKDEEKDEIFKYGSAIGIKFNIILSIILVFISQFASMKFDSAGEYLLLLSINPILLIIFDFQQIYFRSKMENKKYAMISSLNTFLVVMGAIVGVILASVNGMIIGRNTAYLVTIIFVFYKLNVPIRLSRGHISKEDKKALFKISIISMLNNGMSQLLYLLDIFLLGLILADESVIASYKVATVIPTAMAFIPSAIVTYIYPYFAANKDNKKWCLKNYYKLIKYFGGVNLVLTIVMIIFAELIVIFVYGAKYVDSALCFRILAISYFFSGTFRMISGNLLVTQRRLGFNLMVNIVSGSLNIVGNIILIPTLESLGAAITTLMVVVVSSMLSTIYYIYILKR